MNKKQIFFPILLTVFTGLGFWAGNFFKTAPERKILTVQSELDSTILMQDRFQEIVRYIEAKYYKKIDENSLIDKAIKKVVSELDPYSSYLTKEEVLLNDLDMRGEFGGIGINSVIIRDTLFVSDVLPQANFKEGSLQVGDAIVGIDSFSLVGTYWDSIRLHMIGEVDSEANLVIQRNNQKFNVVANRVKLVSPNIPESFMIDSSMAYLRIDAFNANTYKQFIDSLEYLYQNGARKLILDLRNNPGGYLRQAVQVANQFLPQKDMLLVYTQGEQSKKSEYFSTGKVFFPLDKVVVLINENSASAAEVVAGALQDNDIAFIVGRPSYGKGLVQSQFTMNDGAGLKLTIAKYYTPSGRCIQKNFKQELSDTSYYFTLAGRQVRGGGGIEPDFEVPATGDILNEKRNTIISLVQLYAAEKHMNIISKSKDIFAYLKENGLDLSLNSKQRKFIQDTQDLFMLRYRKDFQAYQKELLEYDNDIQQAVKLLYSDKSPNNIE